MKSYNAREHVTFVKNVDLIDIISVLKHLRRALSKCTESFVSLNVECSINRRKSIGNEIMQ